LLYVWIAVGAAIAASVSLQFPSNLSYDAWSWVVWGRQVVHLQLVTAGGPTWKPLPVIFTTLLAPFGAAAPNLWLIVARAGGIMTVPFAFMLAFRLTRGRALPVPTGPGTAAGRAGVPALLAGLIAAIGVLTLSRYVGDAALGDSEGLLVAVTLTAILRHLDHAPRQALMLGFAAALDRPEAWPFLGLYATWLWREDASARKLIAGLGALLPMLWFGPELWGSGTLNRGVLAAQHPLPGSATFAQCPFCTEITDHAWPLVVAPIKLGAAIALATAGAAVWTRRRAPDRRDLAVLVIGVIAVVWLLEDAVLTELGFSGNNRYLLAPGGLLLTVGAVGWGTALCRLGDRLAGFRVRTPALVCAVAVLAPAGVAIAARRDPDLISMTAPAGLLGYQAQLRDDLVDAVQQAGGGPKLLACGPIQANRSEVPLMAWMLGVPLRSVENGHGEVIVQSRNAAETPVEPAVPRAAHYRPVADAGTVKIFTHCRRAPTVDRRRRAPAVARAGPVGFRRAVSARRSTSRFPDRSRTSGW
jgi:hypothetical protein